MKKMNNIAKSKILIVDDNDNIVQTLKIRLEASGYSVVCAPNGLEGIKMAGQENPDLILLNVIMPKQDGFMTTLKLKGDSRLKSIPVIIMTGIAQKDEMVLAKNLGAFDYIVKPFDSEELLEKISRALNNK